MFARQNNSIDHFLDFGEIPMNRTRQSSFLLLLLSVLAALSFSASSFAQDDGSQFADESYSEEEAEQTEEKSAAPADEPAEEATAEPKEEVDVWTKEDELDEEEDEDERP
jgi:hypothetical protein